MILVDTSVWIEFFRRNEIYFDDLRKHIEGQSEAAVETSSPVWSLDKKLLSILPETLVHVPSAP